jgi:hypothetical protein
MFPRCPTRLPQCLRGLQGLQADVQAHFQARQKTAKEARYTSMASEASTRPGTKLFGALSSYGGSKPNSGTS